MIQLTKDQLKEYLQIITELEQACYFQNLVMGKLINKINALGLPHQYNKPVQKEVSDSDRIGCGTAIRGVFLGLVVYIISGIILSEAKIVYLPLSASIVFILGGILFVFLRIEYQKSEKQKQLDQEYEKQMEGYRQSLAMDEQRVQQELNQKAYLELELQKLNQIHLHTKKTLEKVYAKNICFPKYRNMVAMFTIYEYICSGRTSTLEAVNGDQGAYNLYEAEVMGNVVIAKLDEIIQRIDHYGQQFLLCRAIHETNNAVSRTVSSVNQLINQTALLNQQADNITAILQSIASTSAINAYQTYQANKELEYMNRIKMITGEYPK